MNDKVLLVDDEPGVRTVVGLALEDAGYEVIPAESGIQALGLFEEHLPSVVVTDIKMPGVDGVALLKELKDQSPDTEVIMVTGHGDLSLAIDSLRHGAADFINKPVSDEALQVAMDRARERIRIREALREHTEHLERLVQDKTRELLNAERLAAVGEAVADISHTIKNIASSLEGGMFVLDKGIQLNKRKYLFEGWELISGGVEKVKNLSLDLLNYAKFTRISPAPADPVEPAREVVRLLAKRAETLGVDLALEAPENLDRVSLDRVSLDSEALVRALMNLVDNGLDACKDLPQGSPRRVTLKVEQRDGQVVYTVADTGPGVPQGERDKLFSGFFSTKGTAGTGIGLMASKRVAEEHGGSVSAKFPEQGGSVFTMSIPQGS